MSIVLKSGSLNLLEPSGPLQASNGIALPLPLLLKHRNRDSSVGIATRYGLDGPEIESRWGRDFLHPFTPTLGPTQPPILMGTGSFPGVKRPGRGVDHPPPASVEVNEKVEL